MDDSFSPPQQHVGEYWSVADGAWVRSPVTLPTQRVDEPEPARVDA